MMIALWEISNPNVIAEEEKAIESDVQWKTNCLKFQSDLEIVTSRQPEFESMLIPRGATLLLWQLHVLWIVLMNFLFCIVIAIVFDFDFANVFIENTVKYIPLST